MRQVHDALSPRSVILIVLAIGIGAITWLGAILLIPGIRFVVLAPTAKTGVDIILALASFFSALVLWLFPNEGTQVRLRWIAAGFLMLGLGGLVFGYLQPLLVDDLDLNRSRYVSLLIQTVAGSFFVVGLLSDVPRGLSSYVLGTIMIAVIDTGVVVYDQAGTLPVLTRANSLDIAARSESAIMEGLTGWHWIISSVPLVLAVAAVVGVVRWQRSEGLGLWLVAAVTLLVGAQLHAMFWPSGYGPVLTTASLLRLGFTFIVVFGGILELRRIAAERTALLAAAQAYSRRMDQLAVLKADFTAMVAHELNGPVAAIRRFADIAAIGDTDPHQQHALNAMQHELDILSTLIADVQASATIEREDFGVQLRCVPLDLLLADAKAYAQTLPGERPITVEGTDLVNVRADPERINQVIRNLLSNAAKYSAAGTPIDVRASCDGRQGHITVTDHGYGIHPDDLDRVLEKFGRGRDLSGQKVGGVGLGLYLSRRIVQVHGSDLRISSTLGQGTIVSFALAVEQ